MQTASKMSTRMLRTVLAELPRKVLPSLAEFKRKKLVSRQKRRPRKPQLKNERGPSLQNAGLMAGNPTAFMTQPGDNDLLQEVAFSPKSLS